jgi:hypothetical protein
MYWSTSAQDCCDDIACMRSVAAITGSFLVGGNPKCRLLPVCGLIVYKFSCR